MRRLAWVLLASMGSICSGQVIKIRVLDIKNTHPLANLHVSLSLLYAKGEKAPATHDGVLDAKTDASGEAHFGLLEPAPVLISAFVELPSDLWRCGCSVPMRTQDVVDKGAVGPRPPKSSGKPAKLVRAAPGEIVLLVRPPTMVERILAPLLRE